MGRAAALGGLAAGAQIAAYLVYIRLFVSGKIRPNAVSWLMFAYGTALMVFLESRNDAAWFELALPTACAAMSVIVAVLCLRRNATEPVDLVEKVTFGADLALSIAYLLVALFVRAHSKYAVAFLIAGNITTFTSFAPMVRSTWKSPQREQPLPWLMWTFAYGLLFASTLTSEGFRSPELLLYPGLCVVLHGLIAAFSVRRSLTKSSPSSTASIAGMAPRVPPVSNVELRPSRISGDGIHATVPFAPREVICELTGTILLNVATDAEPNCIGVAPGVWIDPEFPLVAINHSCEPNTSFASERTLVSLRPIGVGEELTLDYSTTEADVDWQMDCRCRAPTCRQTLRAIQIAFAGAEVVPSASPAMQQVWANERFAYQARTIDLTQTESVPVSSDAG
jgi:hypothetical protein